MYIERIQLQQHGDHRGMLIALEKDRNVPFEIRRVYYLFATRCGVHRGMPQETGASRTVLIASYWPGGRVKQP